MAAVMSEVLAKGVSFLYARTYIVAKYGQETWEKVVRSMPPESREIWAHSLLATNEYPFTAFKDMMSSLASAPKTAKDAEPRLSTNTSRTRASTRCIRYSSALPTRPS
jgi:hypothetical protein